MKYVFTILAVVIVGMIVVGGLFALGAGELASGWIGGVAMTAVAFYYTRDEKPKTNIDLDKTQRGFATGSFTDHYGAQCSIQKSSLACIDAIWLGVDDPDPKIMCSDAIRMGLKQREGGDADNGWTAFEIPKEVMINTRMHLTQKQVTELLPMLEKFAKTGDL